MGEQGKMEVGKAKNMAVVIAGTASLSRLVPHQDFLFLCSHNRKRHDHWSLVNLFQPSSSIVKAEKHVLPDSDR